MKLFKQKQKIEKEGDFYIVAKDKKDASYEFAGNANEITDILVKKVESFPEGDIEEIIELTPEEEDMLYEVIWDKEGLKKEINTNESLKRLKEVIE